MARLELRFDNSGAQNSEILPGFGASAFDTHYGSNVRDSNVAPGDLIYAVTDIGIAWNGSGYVGARDANDFYYVGKVGKVGQGVTECLLALF